MVSSDPLDDTIRLLNEMLEQSDNVKEKLAITDRLLRAHAMKLKFTNEGKGGKFASLETPEIGAHSNGN